MKRGDLLEWLKRSPRRTAVMKTMTKPKTISEIREEDFKGVGSLSNTTELLQELVREGLVVCLNGEDRVGRLYGLTKKGKEIQKKLLGSESVYRDLTPEILTGYVWVMRGKHRRTVIKVMADRKMPSEVHKDVIRSSENLAPGSINYIELSLNSTSDTLRGFRKKGIAVCINPEDRVGRVYELTKKGKLIRDLVLIE